MFLTLKTASNRYHRKYFKILTKSLQGFSSLSTHHQMWISTITKMNKYMNEWQTRGEECWSFIDGYYMMNFPFILYNIYAAVNVIQKLMWHLIQNKEYCLIIIVDAQRRLNNAKVRKKLIYHTSCWRFPSNIFRMTCQKRDQIFYPKRKTAKIYL